MKSFKNFFQKAREAYRLADQKVYSYYCRIFEDDIKRAEAIDRYFMRLLGPFGNSKIKY